MFHKKQLGKRDTKKRDANIEEAKRIMLGKHAPSIKSLIVSLQQKFQSGEYATHGKKVENVITHFERNLSRLLPGLATSGTPITVKMQVAKPREQNRIVILEITVRLDGTFEFHEKPSK